MIPFGADFTARQPRIVSTPRQFMSSIRKTLAQRLIYYLQLDRYY